MIAAVGSYGHSVSINFHRFYRKIYSTRIPRPHFESIMPTGLMRYAIKKTFSSDPLYELAFGTSEARHRQWEKPEVKERVVHSFETLAKQGVLRHIALNQFMKIISKALDVKDRNELLELIQKEALLKNLPKIAERVFSYHSLHEIERIIQQSPNSRPVEQLIKDLFKCDNKGKPIEIVTLKTRAHNMIANFIPNLIDLFLKAFTLFDLGRIEGIWEISYMISILCKVIFIPWAIITFLEPLLVDAFLVYTVTGVACLVALTGVYAYLRWFRPTPKRLHYYFTNLNEDANNRQPILGRNADLNWLCARLSAAVEGNGKPILIVGESGVGKSSLVKHLFKLIATKKVVEKNLEDVQGFGIAVASLEGNANYEGFSAILKSVESRIRGFEKKIAFCFSGLHTAKKNGAFLREFLVEDFFDNRKFVAICLTSKEAFDKHIKGDLEFRRRFEILKLKPSSEDVSDQILRDIINRTAKEFEFEDEALDLLISHSYTTNPKNQPSHSIDILEAIINDKRLMNVHLKCEEQLEEKKIRLNHRIDHFERNYVGINESVEAKQKREEIELLEKEIQSDERIVDLRKKAIKLLTSLIERKKELRQETKKLASTILKQGSRRSRIDVMKKKIIQIEGYQIPEINKIIKAIPERLMQNIKAEMKKQFVETKQYTEAELETEAQLNDALKKVSKEPKPEFSVNIDKETVVDFIKQDVVESTLKSLPQTISEGKKLRIAFDQPSEVQWKISKSKNVKVQKTAPNKSSVSNKYYTDIPTDVMKRGASIEIFIPGKLSTSTHIIKII
jgi:energy-coupling factor transporter ATP-binding protein EcfA2